MSDTTEGEEEGADSTEGTAAVSHNAEEGFGACCVSDIEKIAESRLSKIRTTPAHPATRGRV